MVRGHIECLTGSQPDEAWGPLNPMANDRIFLRCDKCGDADLLLLYKMFGAGLSRYVHTDPERMAKWLAKHEGCHPEPYGDLKGVPGFSVTTESTSEETTYESIPCDHPQTKKLPNESRKSLTHQVTVTQCTTCGHRVTLRKQLVPRELL